MNIEKLLKKREYYQKNKGFIPALTKESYKQKFEIEYVHNSTAINGNTLILIETKIKNIINNKTYQDTDKHTQSVFSKTNEICKQIKDFYINLIPNDKNFNSIEFVAKTHAEIIKTYHFGYGNRYMAGLIINHQFMSNEFFPISIAKENRFDYFGAL